MKWLGGKKLDLSLQDKFKINLIDRPLDSINCFKTIQW